ncbi:bifunctional DNA primase/polymerase [Gimesia alba]|nr:bifunctional DNA primase/polymerase [Gimesia alba]
MLQAALEYALLGWKVFPVLEPPVGTQFPRPKEEAIKKPRIKEWQHKATDDPRKIAAWWGKWPRANIGILMGPKSGIIVIDTDSEEGEEKFISLFGGPENIPETVKWRTARGNHYVFRWCDGLPADVLRRAHWPYTDSQGKKHDIDFKLGGNAGTYAQAPPSIHPRTGEQYQLVCDPEDFPIAELPDIFLANFYADTMGEGIEIGSSGEFEAKPDEYWKDIQSGVAEGGRNNAAASYAGKLLCAAECPNIESRVSVKSRWESLCFWNENYNKPPLSVSELRTTFEEILATERKKRSLSNMNQGLSHLVPMDPETGEPDHNCFVLAHYNSEPPMKLLYSSSFITGKYKAINKFLKIPPEDFPSGAKMRNVFATQLNPPMILNRKLLTPFWEGSKDNPSFAQILADDQIYIEAPDDEKRSHIILDVLYELAMKAKDSDENDYPDPSGVMTKRNDGSIYFKVRKILTSTEFMYFDDKVSERELSDVLGRIGVQVKNSRYGEDRKRVAKFRVITTESLHVMDALRDGSPSEDGFGTVDYILRQLVEKATAKNVSLQQLM